ncbi:MAG: PA0069 family radical SAM protein, partial [Pseudooceanicola nanhaiensis]
EMHGGKDYDAQWGKRMRGEGHHAQMIGQRFARAARRLGLDRALPPLSCDLFRPPVPRGAQMDLFG